MKAKGTNRVRSLAVLCEARISNPKRKARQNVKKGLLVMMEISVCRQVTRSKMRVNEAKARQI